MPGGLLQLVSYGSEDKHLTSLPQITFFKIVYRRYTNFSLEAKEIDFDTNTDFSLETSLILPKMGDLIHRMYLKIKIPKLSLNYSSINNDTFTNYISSQQESINIELSDLKSKLENLGNYANVVIGAYKIIKKSLKSENINVSYLQVLINTYKNSTLTEYNYYLQLIEPTIIDDTDLICYISDLSEIKSSSELEVIIEKKYQHLLKLLKIYQTRYKIKYDEYQDILSTNIFKSWIPYLGHFIVNNYAIEIGGNKIDSYSSDYLHIHQSHSMADAKKGNYNELIGNISELIKFDKEDKETITLLVPLIFWFCLDHGVSLPLIGLRWNDVKINIKLNDVRNLIGLENWGEEWKLICEIKYYKENFNISSYSDNNLYVRINDSEHYFKKTNLSYKVESDMIIYKSNNIYFVNLEKHFLDLPSEKINNILETWGSIKTEDTSINEYSLNELEWTNFRREVYSNSDYDDYFHDYHRYLDKDTLLNNIHLESASLIIEYVFLDDMERNKFANSNLEYVIQQTQESNFYKNTKDFSNCELDFSNPIKELFWFIQPTNMIESKPYFNIPYRHIYQNWILYPYSIASKINLELNHLEILSDTFDNKYFQKVIPYKYLINEIPDGVNYYSFSLYPEEAQPSGTCNFSAIKGKILKIYYNDDVKTNTTDVRIVILARNYNILNVSKGRAKLIFY